MIKKIILSLSMLMSFTFTFGESDNNDCYWFGRCMYLEYDSNGQPIQSKAKYMYPENEDCTYEIQFDYASNYQTAAYPITIYLNERSSERGRVSSKKIGTVIRAIKSSVEYKQKGVNIFVEGYQVTVTSDGKVLVYKTEHGSYKNNLLFVPLDYQKPVYEVRYEVLVEKLKSIKWGN